MSKCFRSQETGTVKQSAGRDIMPDGVVMVKDIPDVFPKGPRGRDVSDCSQRLEAKIARRKIREKFGKQGVAEQPSADTKIPLVFVHACIIL